MEIATLLAGRRGGECEDALRVGRVDAQTALLALADAASVERGGDLAAAFAVELAIDAMRAMAPHKRRKHKVWERTIREIDARIADQTVAGEASLVAIVVDGAHIYGASVGKCAAWELSKRDQHDLTATQPATPLIGSGAAAGAYFETTIASPDDTGRGGGTLVMMTGGAMAQVDRKHLVDAALHMSAENAIARIEEVARWRFNGALAEDVGAIVVRR